VNKIIPRLDLSQSCPLLRSLFRSIEFFEATTTVGKGWKNCHPLTNQGQQRVMSSTNREEEVDLAPGDTVIDASPTRFCWLPCALLHCGFWPFSTGKFVSVRWLFVQIKNDRLFLLYFLYVSILTSVLSTVLTLHKDSVTRHDVALCGERTSLRPYSVLGRVEPGFCCCFICVDSNLGTIMPSFGCDREHVNYIVAQLQERSKAHVDDRRRNLQDAVVHRAASIHEKTELLNRYLEKAKKSQIYPAPLSMVER